jgi:hypothetical protein
MNRRHFLTTATLAATSGFAPAADAKSTKKGYCCMHAEQARKLNAVWTYNWGPSGSAAPGMEFVPMIKGTPHFRPGLFEGVTKLAQEKKATHLLGYNEPERKDQGNLTVAAALELWPKLEAIGLPLGSPAPSSDGGGMKWLEEFMAESKKKKYRIDFVALHWYRSNNSGDFEGWLKEMNRKYKLPLWITEFNGAKGDDRTHERFLKDVVKSMERLKFVERYAYFTPGPGKPGSLWTNENDLSELGKFYQSV